MAECNTAVPSFLLPPIAHGAGIDELWRAAIFPDIGQLHLRLHRVTAVAGVAIGLVAASAAIPTISVTQGNQSGSLETAPEAAERRDSAGDRLRLCGLPPEHLPERSGRMASGAAGAPLLAPPTPQEHRRPRLKKRTMTGALSKRLLAEAALADNSLSDADHEALALTGTKLHGCAYSEFVHRCGHPMCPCCARHASRKHVAALDHKLRDVWRRPDRPELLFATLTLPCSDLKDAFPALAACLQKLRRRELFSAVAGGAFYVDPKVSDCGATLFNLHAHGILELKGGARIMKAQLAAEWKQLVGAVGYAGSSDVTPVYDPWAPPKGSTKTRGRFAAYVGRRARGALVDAPVHALIQLAQHLPRRRLVVTFGSWRGWRPPLGAGVAAEGNLRSGAQAPARRVVR